jgi:hypothetical protein
MICDLKLPVHLLTSSFFSCLLESKGCPRLGNLVGLLGGLEGRVAGVVLELVGCGGTSLVSNLGESARWVELKAIAVPRSPGLCSYPPSSSKAPLPELPGKWTTGAEVYVLLARVVARELMPYAMIRPVIETALAPLSSNVIAILRALPRVVLPLFLVFIVES